MRVPRRFPAIYLAVAGAAVAFAVLAWLRPHTHRADKAVPAVSYSLRTGHMEEWKAFGGSWEIVNDAIRSNSSERGAKLVAGSTQWANYTLSTDMRFDGVAADMGVVVRTNDESRGVDSYNGYFVGLRSLDGTLVMGHSNYSWIEVRPVFIPGGVHPFIWYRLRVTAYECTIAASVQNLTTLETAWIAFEERSCVQSGRFGLRSLNANALWRNINITPATSADYLDIRRHAPSVEHLVILDGPPWWTPWHVGMLFAVGVALALLIQLSYFRFQQWKAFTIMQERERLAHEIHDTMAQSFAGVGYQIQGIRRSVVRSGRQDSNHIAEQLSVAYQLVRRCHEEASRTIAMLGSTSPQIQQNLLGALEETATRIAGDEIRTITILRGNSTPLTLRLVDALLHIGQEAIANAVSHSEPTELRITLCYEEKSVELIVEDNGQGFENTPERAGFGILGMQKRARDVAGILQILSRPGHGTQVRVKASLRKEKLRQRVFGLFSERFMSVPPDLGAQ